MRYRDSFSACHPVVCFVYFALVLLFSMCFMHPIYLAVTVISVAVYAVRLLGGKGALRAARYLLPMMLVAAVLNPAFNHAGMTVLRYLPSGNPLTLESIAYGVAAAVMLGSVFAWFSCYVEVITSDKFVYIFGRVIPALSLVLSMALRFVPAFRGRIREVAAAQRDGTQSEGKQSILTLAGRGLTILSVVITWSLESAIETADSMKSRGYGLAGRTSFSIFRFDSRDVRLLCWLILCGVYIICGWIAGEMKFNYYPRVSVLTPYTLQLSFMAVYGALCLTPVALDAVEIFQFRRVGKGRKTQ